MYCTVRQNLWSVIRLELLSHLLKLLKPLLILVNHSWLGREERGRGEGEREGESEGESEGGREGEKRRDGFCQPQLAGKRGGRERGERGEEKRRGRGERGRGRERGKERREEIERGGRREKVKGTK